MTETLSAMLTNIGSFLAAALDWVGQVLTTITGDPMLFIFVIAMPVCGIAVGLLNRLIRA